MYPYSCAPLAWRRAALAAGVLALAATALTAASAQADAAPDPAASWHGRAIRDPHRSVTPAALRRWPAVRLGTGYEQPDGSRRVRAIQRMLRRLGYRPGPLDGRFGPRTAAAVRWFEYKHGLPRARGIGRSALALLRSRAAGRPDRLLASTAPGERDVRAGRQQPRETQPATPTAVRASGGLDLTPILIGLGAILVLLLTVAQVRRAARVEEPEGLGTMTAQRPRAAIGYVAFPRGSGSSGVSQDVLAAFEHACVAHGWNLGRVIHDVEPASGRLSDRPGLFHALEAIAAGNSAGLIVGRLRDLTASASDLGPLMRWMDDAGAGLVVLDVGLDTTVEPGRRTARTLVEVSDWERRRLGERTRAGLEVARSQGRSSRPAVRDDPDLTAWIERMRADGMSLQAIADTLNAEQVPTLRGGARWRPSSVQAATGYKRPAAKRAAELPPVPPPRGEAG
jgi:DNA invertase Pin-like site-specific DNA recombinase